MRSLAHGAIKRKNVADRLSGNLAALFVSAVINKKAAVTLVLKISRSFYFLLVLLFLWPAACPADSNFNTDCHENLAYNKICLVFEI